jgi:hypothetical protein
VLPHRAGARRMGWGHAGLGFLQAAWPEREPPCPPTGAAPAPAPAPASSRSAGPPRPPPPLLEARRSIRQTWRPTRPATHPPALPPLIGPQVACGAGLVRIYRFLAEDAGRPVVYKTPAAVSTAALAGFDPLAGAHLLPRQRCTPCCAAPTLAAGPAAALGHARQAPPPAAWAPLPSPEPSLECMPPPVEALDMLLEIVGAEAGHMALRGLATGGVYICGGIFPKARPAPPCFCSCSAPALLSLFLLSPLSPACSAPLRSAPCPPPPPPLPLPISHATWCGPRRGSWGEPHPLIPIAPARAAQVLPRVLRGGVRDAFLWRASPFHGKVGAGATLPGAGLVLAWCWPGAGLVLGPLCLDTEEPSPLATPNATHHIPYYEP